MSVTLESRVAALEAEFQVLKARLTSTEKGRTSKAELPEVDIDDKYGDPVVKKDPPRWDGPSYVGSPFSRCTPKYLREMAGFLQWRAAKEREQPEKAKYEKYSMLDAARALAWAARIESAPPKSEPMPEDEVDGDIPF